LVLGDVRCAADVKQRSTAKRSVERGSASSDQSQYRRQGHVCGLFSRTSSTE